MAKGELTVQEARKAYQELSGKAGELVRQAGYAGIAMIWALKPPTEAVPAVLVKAGFYLFLALAADLFTYIIPAYIWAAYARYKETRVTEGSKFVAPMTINWPYIAFALLRYVFIVVAYSMILKYLWVYFHRT